jgi:hypothetical protein
VIYREDYGKNLKLIYKSVYLYKIQE